MKKLIFLLFLPFLAFTISSCTPLLIGGAAVGGAYVGYKAAREGYTIQITKPIKGNKNGVGREKSSEVNR